MPRRTLGGGRLPRCLAGPFRVILHNGYPGHGDPAHAGPNAHIHVSWRHAPARPFTPAAWADTLGAQ